MKIRVSEHHTKLRPAVRTSIIGKLESLERYFDRIISIDAVVEEEKNHFIVRVVAHLVRKKIVKAEAQASDFPVALNEALESLKAQLTRYKDQLKDHRNNLDAGGDPEAAEANAHGEDGRMLADHILRTEVHLRKPMTVEEALMQLDAYNRDLFMFDDAEGGGLRILHRHPDGQVELLEPKY